jgi:hypothetical protein
MKHLFLYTVAACAFLMACKKEKEEVKEEEKPATEDLDMKRISAHQWIIYKLEAGGTDLWGFPGIIETCMKDDSYRFYKDSTLMQYENAKVCSGGKDSAANRWQFYDNKKKLIGTMLGITDTVDVISLQDTTMQFSLDYQGTPALIYFKKKN